jgi:hypothetical protein
LVWTEQDYPAQNGARLVVFDLESGVSRVLDDSLPQMSLSADGLPTLFTWGEAGIVVFTNDPFDNASALRIYDAETGLSQMLRLPDDEGEWYPLHGPLWLENTQAETADDVVIVRASERTWYQINPTTGAVTEVESRLKLLSAANPEESLQLVWDIYNYYSVPVEAALQLLVFDGTKLLTWVDLSAPNVSGALTQFVISPSGHAAAYLQDGVLYLWQQGNIDELALPQDLLVMTLYWGPVTWQMGAKYTFDAVG